MMFGSREGSQDRRSQDGRRLHEGRPVGPGHRVPREGGQRPALRGRNHAAERAEGPRWHVVVIDPWPTNLEQSHSAVPLYGPEGASLRKFADAEHTIELYERYALQRDRQRKMANGQSDPVQS